jgi:hypothetical protein
MPTAYAAANRQLNLMYSAVAWPNVADNASASPLTNTYLRLGTAAYTPSSAANANETTYTGYVPPPVPRNTGYTGWTAAASGVITNTSAIEFPESSAGTTPITDACTTTAASGATEIWHYGTLNSPITPGPGIQPRVPAGSGTITVS